MIHNYKEYSPIIHKSVFLAKNAKDIGDVELDEETSVGFNTDIRRDVATTRIGKRGSIQDLTMAHQRPKLTEIIEDDITIVHQVTIHSGIIRKNALIGMGALILDGAEIGEHAFIGAGSLIPPGKKIPPHTLAFGRPAKVIRE